MRTIKELLSLHHSIPGCTRTVSYVDKNGEPTTLETSDYVINIEPTWWYKKNTPK